MKTHMILLFNNLSIENSDSYFKCAISGHRKESQKTKWYMVDKGRFQKIIRGFCPFRGGIPPFPLSFFEHNECPLRGRVYPPIPLRKIPLKCRFFRSENSIFYPFSYIFSPF